MEMAKMREQMISAIPIILMLLGSMMRGNEKDTNYSVTFIGFGL